MNKYGSSLTQRLGLVTATLLLVTGLLSVIVQVRNGERHANEVLQRVSVNLASHIVLSNKSMLTPDGLDVNATQLLFDRLMEVNPGVEVYLLDQSGQIIADAAPPRVIRKYKVNLAPIENFISGHSLPILGEDPRNPERKKVFSVARLQHKGQNWGYLYIILAGQEYDNVSRDLVNHDLWKLSWMGMLVLLVVGLIAALLALRWITTPLRQLTQEVVNFRKDTQHQMPFTATDNVAPDIDEKNDEIAQLRSAFFKMKERINRQWQQLNEFDQQRRELVANISHDLRTPLTSLHGYLETLKLKTSSLSEADRNRYLEIALSQSKKVGNLAQALFELARLEHGGVKLHKENFFLVDLIQDVTQKFELAMEARKQVLKISSTADLPAVHADLALIERVLTNLLDNAIRHTHEGCTITIAAQPTSNRVLFTVSDNGPGLPTHVKQTVFQQQPAENSGWRLTSAGSSGLGLLIVRRILQLHDTDLILASAPGSSGGTRLSFTLELSTY